MKEIGLEELKKLQLDILLAVHEFCVNNNIEYSLAAGTLIGAIRHKGYIPWDDDIDILMTRPNYDKFLNIFNGAYENLLVLAPEKNWNYYAPYANVCDVRTLLIENDFDHNGIDVGVKIDIFPIDGCSSNRFDFFLQCKKLMRWNSMLIHKRCNPSSTLSLRFVKATIQRILLSIYSYSSIQKKIHKESIRFDYKNSEFAALMVFEPIAFKAPKSFFDEYVNIEFEGHQLRSIRDYDVFLKLRYGDYMKLPPVELQIPHHGFKAFWK